MVPHSGAAATAPPQKTSYLEDNLGEQPVSSSCCMLIQEVDRIHCPLPSWFRPMQEEVVIAETMQVDGSVARIVYRNDVSVDAHDLERLCSKVGCDRSVMDQGQAILCRWTGELASKTGAQGGNGTA